MGATANRSRLPLALAVVPASVLLVVICGAMFIALAAGGAAECEGEAAGSVKGVPAELAPIYRRATATYGLGSKGPSILAAINFIETGFGANLGPSSAGAQGWMQFMPATWAAYGVDGDGDGDKDPDDPWDAIHAAANYLRASGAPEDWRSAIFAYNHADWYVADVLAAAEKYDGAEVVQGAGQLCAPADLKNALKLYAPRSFRALPAQFWIGGGPPQVVDSRIWNNATWLLRTYNLRVTAARESGHETHGDGTALDLVPAPGHDWDTTARRAAVDLGWTPPCGASGIAPVCPLVPAIQFIGYNGFPSHGDPSHAGSNAHLHISWKASEYGCPGLCPPREWVMAFR